MGIKTTRWVTRTRRVDVMFTPGGGPHIEVWPKGCPMPTQDSDGDWDADTSEWPLETNRVDQFVEVFGIEVPLDRPIQVEFSATVKE